MAVAYITEYGSNVAGADVPQGPALATQTVAIGVEAKSSVFQPNTRIVRIHVDAICSLAFGASPTATTSSKRMAANTTERWGVRGGDKVSFISNT